MEDRNFTSTFTYKYMVFAPYHKDPFVARQRGGMRETVNGLLEQIERKKQRAESYPLNPFS